MSGRKNDPSAAAAASTAPRQFDELKRALQSARDALAQLHRALRVPVPKGGKRTVSGSHARPTLLERAGIDSLGGYFGRSLVSEGGGFLDELFGGGALDAIDAGLGFSGDTSGGGSFLPSQTQIAGQIADAAQRGQRIR